MDYLRFSGKSEAEQRQALEDIIRAEPVLVEVLEGLRDIGLNDWLLVAGAIYNTVCNQLTNRPSLTGIKDIDVFYFDDSDLSWEAEDRVIKQVSAHFEQLPLPVETRNQARVHLWFPEKFGQPFAPLKSSSEMMGRYASKTHSVGVKLEADNLLTFETPFGLDDMFSFRMVPNHVLNNKKSHDEKGARAKHTWPELTVEPW